MPVPEEDVAAERPPSAALPMPLRRPIVAVAIVAALVLTLLAVVYRDGSAPGAVDQWVRSVVIDPLPPAHSEAVLIDFVGEPLGLAGSVILLAAVCLALGRQRLALLAVAGTGLTALLTTALKPAVGRTINGGWLSYPSGHTAVATTLALVLALLAVDLLRPGRLAGVLLVLTGASAGGVAMAWSQSSLGAHYPTDTLGGFCAALAVVTATAWLIDRIADRRAVAGEHRRM